MTGGAAVGADHFNLGVASLDEQREGLGQVAARLVGQFVGNATPSGGIGGVEVTEDLFDLVARLGCPVGTGIYAPAGGPFG